MAETGTQAAGFPCPECGHEYAWVESIKLPQLVLRCKKCQTEYAVET